MIRRVDGLRTVSVSAAIDAEISTTSEIQQALEANVLPDMIEKYGISYSFGGRSEEQADAFSDLTLGLYVALALIYLILAWIFGHYDSPWSSCPSFPLGLWGDLGACSDGLSAHLSFHAVAFRAFGHFGERLYCSGDANPDSPGPKACPCGNRSLKARRRACARFFSPSITTVAGLAPLLFEQSLPSAVSQTHGDHAGLRHRRRRVSCSLYRAGAYGHFRKFLSEIL